MTEIAYQKISEFIRKTALSEMPPVCLIHGEPALVEQCAAPVIDHLLAGAPREINCEVIDGLAENIPDLLEDLNTYAMVSGSKVVWFKDAKLFDTVGRQQRMIDQIEKAYGADNIKKAARAFLSLCSQLGIESMSDIAHGNRLPAELNPLLSAVGSDGVKQMCDHINEQGLSAQAPTDYLQALIDAIEKGFPADHFLLITAGSKVPKNRKFYKCIAAKGVVVDCHVPLGERKADKVAQEAVMREIAERSLAAAGKKMAPGLFNLLIQLTGFDPPTFKNNIEKLIDYCGRRADITHEDITSVLKRTKSDPIYELTNAVSERNVESALFYMQTLFDNDYHPLQILAALSNQIRKLMVAKEFTRSAFGRNWRKGLAYPQFQKSVMGEIQRYDAQVAQERLDWGRSDGEVAQQGKKQGGKKAGSELALAPNPGNAYPVYQTIAKSENFSRRELLDTMIRMNETDLRLKSSGQDATLVVKQLVMGICRGSAAS